MQLRKSALFFCIAVSITLFLCLCNWAYILSERGLQSGETFFTWSLSLLSQVGFIVIGAGFMRRSGINKGIAWAIFGLLAFEFVYSMYVQFGIYKQFPLAFGLQYMLQFLLLCLKDIALMGFVIALALGRQFNKAMVIWLFVAGMFEAVLNTSFLINVDFYDRFITTLNDNSQYWIFLLLNISGVVLCISNVLLAIALDEKEREDVASGNQFLAGSDDLLDENMGGHASVAVASSESMSLKRWIFYVYFSTIPVVGWALLIAWIAKKGNLVLTNWSFARGVVSILGTVLFLLWMFSGSDYPGQVFLWIIVGMLLMLMVMAILWQNRENKSTEDDWEADRVSGWIGRQVVAGLPLIGLIMLIIWASTPDNISRRRWAAAQLIASGMWTICYLWIFYEKIDRLL